MKWVKVNHQGQPTYGILNGEKISLTSHTWHDILRDKPVEMTGEINQETAVLLNPIGTARQNCLRGLELSGSLSRDEHTPTRTTTAIHQIHHRHDRSH